MKKTNKNEVGEKEIEKRSKQKEFKNVLYVKKEK
jgi:hypothetical protein